MSFIKSFVPSRICIHLGMLPPDVWEELQAESFTVQRNSKNGGPKSGEPGSPEEKGWRIQQKSHSNGCGPGYVCGGGATFCEEDPNCIEELGDAVASNLYILGSDKTPTWSVFMNNGFLNGVEQSNSELHTHCCGWRVCSPTRRSFWPTRLTTQEEKEKWWVWFDRQLDSLPLWSTVLEERARRKATLPIIKEEEEEAPRNVKKENISLFMGLRSLTIEEALSLLDKEKKRI